MRLGDLGLWGTLTKAQSRCARSWSRKGYCPHRSTLRTTLAPFRSFHNQQTSRGTSWTECALTCFVCITLKLVKLMTRIDVARARFEQLRVLLVYHSRVLSRL